MRQRWSCPLLTGFFERLTDQELENRYDSILEEQYILKKHANLSIQEQELIHAEDRRWWLERIKKDHEEEESRASRARQ